MSITSHASDSALKVHQHNTGTIQPPELLVPSEAKWLAKTLRYLRDDLKLAYPKLPTPSSWMIHSLAHAYLKSLVANNDYTQAESHQQRLIDLLHAIKRVADGSSDEFPLLEPDADTALFPNTEEYTTHHLHSFAELALGYLGVSDPPFLSE